jgi:hypothetical protein
MSPSPGRSEGRRTDRVRVINAGGEVLIAHMNMPTITPTASAARATFRITSVLLMSISFPGYGKDRTRVEDDRRLNVGAM